MGLQFPIVMLMFFSGLVLAFQHEHNQQIKVIVLETSKAELTGLAYNSLLVLSSRHNCRVNFKGQTFANVGGVAMLQPASILLADPASGFIAANMNPSGTVLSRGQSSGIVTVQNIQIVKGQPIVAGSRSFRGEIRIIGRSRNQQDLSQTFPAYFTMENPGSNVIEDCSVTDFVDGENTIEDMMCRSYANLGGDRSGNGDNFLAAYYPNLGSTSVLKYDPSYVIKCRLM